MSFLSHPFLLHFGMLKSQPISNKRQHTDLKPFQMNTNKCVMRICTVDFFDIVKMNRKSRLRSQEGVHANIVNLQVPPLFFWSSVRSLHRCTVVLFFLSGFLTLPISPFETHTKCTTFHSHDVTGASLYKYIYIYIYLTIVTQVEPRAVTQKNRHGL